MNKIIDFKQLVNHFQFEGDYIYEKPFGCGHINDTFVQIRRVNVIPPYQQSHENLNYGSLLCMYYVIH